MGLIMINAKKGSRRFEMKKVFLIVCCLVFAIGIMGCGNNQTSLTDSGGPQAEQAAKTAKISMSFNFPGSDGEKNAELLSTAMTHVYVEVSQRSVDSLGNMRLSNRDKAVATAASPTISMDLLPGYTRICATQFKGDPNDHITTSRLETACSTGELVEGANTITLTMLRGTWVFFI